MYSAGEYNYTVGKAALMESPVVSGATNHQSLLSYSQECGEETGSPEEAEAIP